MSLAIINDWLLVRGDFAVGVDLLKTFGRLTPAQQFLFSQGESPFARERLTAALSEIKDVALQRQVDRPVLTQTSTEREDLEDAAATQGYLNQPGVDLPEHALPAELRPLRAELRTMHTTMTFMRGSLSGIPDGMELRKVAESIVELRKRINAGWFTIETYRATGTVISHAPRDVRDRFDLQRELNSVRVQISKVRHGVRKVTPEELKAMEVRRDSLIQLINGAGKA